jgi:hypothetical protein
MKLLNLDQINRLAADPVNRMRSDLALTIDLSRPFLPEDIHNYITRRFTRIYIFNIDYDIISYLVYGPMNLL